MRETYLWPNANGSRAGGLWRLRSDITDLLIIALAYSQNGCVDLTDAAGEY